MELANHLDMVVMAMLVVVVMILVVIFMVVVILVVVAGGDHLFDGDNVGGGGDLLNHLETLPIAAPLRSWNCWSPLEPPEKGKAPE